ncbi:MAG TPA: helix-turn-helix transcriptional regulator [Candidatus Acidoferrum sp.]|nr:helix-turn-helix transcriptional regulator [Candidatus Acidoferrum sp.]
MDYGKALKISRAIAGLQQKELAGLAGVNASHICLIELGKRKPSVGMLDKLCDALKIPTHLFMLLGAQREDLSIADPKEVHRAAESIAHLLFSNAPKSRKQAERRAH